MRRLSHNLSPELGVFLFRVFLGTVLIWGVVDNVVSRERMLEFSDFLARNGFPVPWYCAHLSVYAQLVCGGLLVVGAFTRAAAAVMVVHFLVALGMVHVGLPFSANIAPLAMLFGAILFLFHGGGAYSVDARRR